MEKELQQEKLEFISAVILAGLLANPGVNPNAKMVSLEYPARAVSIARALLRALDEEHPELEYNS